MLEDVRYWCALVKDLVRDVLVDCVLMGLPLLHLTLWLLSDKFLHGVLFLSLPDGCSIYSKVCQQFWRELAGGFAQESVPEKKKTFLQLD